MRTSLTRPIVNLLALIVTLAINGLANALPLNGQTTGDISNRFDVFFVPAGYVFSIWGLIYLALTGFVIYQLLPAQRTNPRLNRLGWGFVVSCAFNIGWLFAWHYEQFGLSMLLIVGLLVTLIVCYNRLEVGQTAVPPGERWLLQAPFSIYLGWLTVATIANATTVLNYYGWNGWGISAEVWTIILLVVGVALAAAFKLGRGDNLYLLVLAWAFAGIAIKHADTPVVTIAAWIATALVAALLFVPPRRARRGLIRMGAAA